MRLSLIYPAPLQSASSIQLIIKVSGEEEHIHLFFPCQLSHRKGTLKGILWISEVIRHKP